VVKIGAGNFNRRQFQNEAESLRRLAGLAHPFAIPAVLFEHSLDDDRYLLAVGGFPSHLRSMSAAQASHRSASVIEHLASLRFAHGDLGPGNMLVDDDGGLFLFDWENASAAAPARVDEIGFWLSLRQGRALRAPRGQVEALRRDFRDVPETELRAALDFLRARDNLAATRLLEVWE
jgi:aminoglycoside phosphotransferase (APT) family kinase protein